VNFDHPDQSAREGHPAGRGEFGKTNQLKCRFGWGSAKQAPGSSLFDDRDQTVHDFSELLLGDMAGAIDDNVGVSGKQPVRFGLRPQLS